MKSFTTLLILPALFLASACSGDDVEAKMGDMADAAKEAGSGVLDKLPDVDLSSIDLTSLSADGAKEKLTELAGGLTDQLGSIKDMASAEAITEKLGPVVDMMGKLKGLVGDKMPSMDSVKSAVSGLTEKFSGETDIMGVLKPMLDKITSLAG